MGSTPQIHQPTSWGRTSTVEITHTHHTREKQEQNAKHRSHPCATASFRPRWRIVNSYQIQGQEANGHFFPIYLFNRLLAFCDIFDVVTWFAKWMGHVSRWASHGSNSQPITIKAISVWYHNSGEFPSVPTSSCVQYSRWRSLKDISAHLATLALSATGKEWLLSCF